MACPYHSAQPFDPTRLAQLQSNLDVVDQAGADAILILDYMPRCLADTYPGDPRDPTRLPPKDPAVWQSVVQQLAQTAGPGRVAQGKRPVRYFEVWNEPDWLFYQGSQAEFMTNILEPAGRGVAAVAAKSGVDLRFGVCGCLVPDPAWMVPMLQVAKQSGIPIGFVSWHYYANYPFTGPDGPEPSFPVQFAPVLQLYGQKNPTASPESYVIQTGQVRQWVQASLGHIPELMIDEWNISAGGFDKRMDTNEGAAFQAATLAAFASVDLDRASLFAAYDGYTKDIYGNPLPPRYGGWGVVDRANYRKPAWYAQWMWEQLGPTRLASPQDPIGGNWTGAAASAAGVQVLTSSFLASNAQDHDLALSVGGLSRGAWSAAIFRVDGTHPGSTQPAEVQKVVVRADRIAHLDTSLPAQSVVLVELSPTGSAAPGVPANVASLPNTSIASPGEARGPIALAISAGVFVPSVIIALGFALAMFLLTNEASLDFGRPLRNWLLSRAAQRLGRLRVAGDAGRLA